MPSTVGISGGYISDEDGSSDFTPTPKDMRNEVWQSGLRRKRWASMRRHCLTTPGVPSLEIRAGRTHFCTGKKTDYSGTSTKKAPSVTESFQPRLTGLPGDKGRSNILTEKNLAGCRRATILAPFFAKTFPTAATRQHENGPGSLTAHRGQPPTGPPNFWGQTHLNEFAVWWMLPYMLSLNRCQNNLHPGVQTDALNLKALDNAAMAMTRSDLLLLGERLETQAEARSIVKRSRPLRRKISEEEYMLGVLRSRAARSCVPWYAKQAKDAEMETGDPLAFWKRCWKPSDIHLPPAPEETSTAA